MIDWERKVVEISGGEEYKVEEGAAVVDGGEGAVDDASNVHKLFGRRPGKEREAIGECNSQPRASHHTSFLSV